MQIIQNEKLESLHIDGIIVAVICKVTEIAYVDYLKLNIDQLSYIERHYNVIKTNLCGVLDHYSELVFNCNHDGEI